MMMKRLFFVSAIFALCAVSCKSQQGEGPKPTKDPVVYKGVTDPSCAVEVAFGSYGSGIDGAAAKKVQALVDSLGLKHSTKAIGREGEFRYCLPLEELKGRRRKQFISDLKNIAKGGQLVSVSIR
jgi:hypothetical protein